MKSLLSKDSVGIFWDESITIWQDSVKVGDYASFVSFREFSRFWDESITLWQDSVKVGDYASFVSFREFSRVLLARE